MKRLFKILLLSLAVSLFMFGCGDDGDSSGAAKTGKFIDAPVQGLKYVTDSGEGFTDEFGNYDYKEGDSVEFFLGKLSLGKVVAGEMINPMKLVGDVGSEVSAEAANMARLLQTLGTGEGNIVLPTSLNALDLADFDLGEEADLTALLNEAKKLTSEAYTLVSAADATAAMNSAMDLYKNLENYVVYDEDNNSFGLTGDADLIVKNLIIEYDGTFELDMMGIKNTTTMSGHIDYAEGIFKVSTNGEEVDTSATAGVALKSMFPMVFHGGADLGISPETADIPATPGINIDFTYTYTFVTSYGDIVITQKMQ